VIYVDFHTAFSHTNLGLADAGASSCWPSNLSPLFMSGDIEIGTAYVISDSSLALFIDSPVSWSNGWAKGNQATRQNSLTRENEAAPTGFEPVSPP
jgi:hypothetical protein